MPLNRKDQRIGVACSFFAMLLLSLFLIFATLGLDYPELSLSVLGVTAVAILCLCIAVYRSYRKRNQPEVIDYLNVSTQRYILGLFMIFYGVTKLLGDFFDYQLFALDARLGDVSEFQLAWYYFGKNRWLELFSGIMEFVPGILLFHRRTYYIAALILLPVIGQVFILNLFFKIGGITFPAACILLACDAYIIYSQKEKIKQFFSSLDFSAPLGMSNKTRSAVKVLRWVGLVFALLVIFIKARPAFAKSEQYKKYQKLVGFYTLQDMKKNGQHYIPTETDSLIYKDLYMEKQSRWNMLRRFNNETDAFILKTSSRNDSLSLYINEGGAGDDPDIIDSVTVLTGIYKYEDNVLTIKGLQVNDTLELKYMKQALRPKEWFW